MVHKTKKGVIMIYEIKILEAAKRYTEDGLDWFCSYQLTKDEGQYEMALSKLSYAEGLLEAYEILTGVKVGTYQIDEELAKF